MTRSEAGRGTKKRSARSSLAFAIVLLLAAAAARATAPVDVRVRANERAVATQPPVPPTSTFPVRLLLDDDSVEGSLGAASGQNAKQFLWFDRFGPEPGFTLDQIWVLFPPDAPLGGAIELVVFEDGDGDPTNGATLRAAFPATVSADDGDTFSVYSPPAPLSFDSGREVLIGVVPRFIESGVTPFLFPATIDGNASAGRSWLSIWAGDPPDPPLLPADAINSNLDDYQPGNWMIRGFGHGQSPLEIPALGPAGLGILASVLAIAALGLLRRRA